MAGCLKDPIFKAPGQLLYQVLNLEDPVQWEHRLLCILYMISYGLKASAESCCTLSEMNECFERLKG